MKVLRPQFIDRDAKLVSSTVAENDYAEWSSGTAYVAGNTVMVTDDGVHNIYEALQSSTNKYPPDYITGEAPYWLLISATNRWKMFDLYSTTKTTDTTSMTVAVKPGLINSLALLEVYATSVRVQMVDPTLGTLYDSTYSMVGTSGISSWWAYYFEEYTRKDTLVLTDLPQGLNATLTLTFTGRTGEEVRCGMALFGKTFELGRTQYGVKVQVRDFSTKETDDFGNVTIVERPFSKKVSADIWVDPANFGAVIRVLQAHRAIPTMWITTEDDPYTSANVFGFYVDAPVIAESYGYSVCNLEIEGMI